MASFGSNPTGFHPQSTVVADASGNLYGTAPAGGAYAGGTVFEVASGSGAITTLASFNGTNGSDPAGTIALDASGNVYGTTTAGGAFGYGTVFEIAGGSNAITTLVTFNGTNGEYAYSGVTLDAAGNLYGTTEQGGASNEGTVFVLPHGSMAMTTVATFGGVVGANPYGPLTLDAAGNLYGTTENGGANSAGTVFEIARGSNRTTALASFSAPAGSVVVENHVAGVTLDSSGNLYGAIPSNPGEPPFPGALFEIAKGSNTITTLATLDGGTVVGPNSKLIVDESGNILATAESGIFAPNQLGAVFELPAGSTQPTTIASFNGTNGYDPMAGLTEDGSGDLFGTTEVGGANNEGVVFEVAAGTNIITALASFSVREAAFPISGLTTDASGNFYGTSNAGGNGDAGTVFEIARGSNVITTLASAPGAEGPVALDSSGNIYGTRGGLVFELASGSNTTTTLAQFTGQYAPYLQPGVIIDASGNLYGTTEGGNGTLGSVFEIAYGSNAITTLASFPSGTFGDGLTLDASGDLFGLTPYTGGNSFGTVFEIARGSGSITTLASFDDLDGENPDSLTFDSAGNLYGTCSEGGPTGYGTVFEIPAGSATITTLGSFNFTNGSFPGGLTLDASGNIFGPTGGGGPANEGTVFEIARGSNTVTTLVSFNGTNGDSLDGPLVPDGLGSFYGATQWGGLDDAGVFFELTANTTVDLISSAGPNPSTGPQPLTFTAAVTGGVPDGETVSLVDTSNANAVVATGTLGGGSATLTIPAGTLSAGTHHFIAAYAGDASFAASQSAPYAQTVQVAVTGVQVNGNLPSLLGAQRSMVDSVVYSFSEAVNIKGAAATLAIHSGQSGTLPASLTWAAINPNSDDSSMQWAVSFSGAGVVGNSIANGVYDISLNTADISADSNPSATVQPRPTDTFYRLFGDINGDGVVNAADNFQFKTALATYNAAFDSNGDGVVNAADNFQLKASQSYNFANAGIVYTI